MAQLNNENKNEKVIPAEEAAIEADSAAFARAAAERSEKAAKIEAALSPRDLAEEIVRLLDGKRAKGLKLLHVESKTILADYFVICSGSSNTQIRALSAEVEEKLMERGIEPLHVEGYQEASWILMDYASVLVHIFNTEARNFYNLEKLWGEAEEIDISSLTEQE